MALATIRKPDRGGVRIDVTFSDRDDAETVWLHRNKPQNQMWNVEVRSQGRYKITDNAVWFLHEAAVLAAREYLKPDPLDEPAPRA